MSDAIEPASESALSAQAQEELDRRISALEAAVADLQSARMEPALVHYAAVGMLASEWAVFETLVDMRALELAGFPQRPGFCLTAQVIGTTRKLDAYIAVARDMGATKKHLEQLNAFHRDATALAERRNRVIHDPWDTTEKVPARFEVTARRVLRAEWVPFSTVEVGRLIGETSAHIHKFKGIHQTLMAALRT